MGLRGGPLDFAGLGGAALLVVVALALIGIVAAIRGYWGSSARARRVTSAPKDCLVARSHDDDG